MSGYSITKGVFRYTAMPEVMPRVRTLLFGGFGYIPFFIAAVYQMVGLLPKNHPYLLQSNIGKYGIRHVIAQAASNIELSFKNIDQLVLFIAVLAGLVIFVIQFFAIASLFVLQPVYALPTNWNGFFTVTNVGYRTHDIAFMMLDMVFGVPHPSIANTGFFESCIGVATPCRGTTNIALSGINTALFTNVTPVEADQLGPLAPDAYLVFPFPYHDGLHQLFAIYSTALLVIAVMITSYFVATILGETAQSGTPFGRRFNKTWAPLRIVIAFGLLVPLTIGLNSSQYIVLFSAKYGSAFASNGWRYFNDTLAASYFGAGQQMVSVPNVPELYDLTQFMFVARTCKYVHDFYTQKAKIDEAANAGNPTPGPLTVDEQVQAYVLMEDQKIPNNSIMVLSGTSYAGVKGVYTDNVRTMRIRFGIKDEDKYGDSQSGVSPVCGEVTLPFTDGSNLGLQLNYVETIQSAYFRLARDLWHNTAWNGVSGGPGFPAFSPVLNHRYRFIADRGVNGLPISPPATLLTTPLIYAGSDQDHAIPLDPIYVQNINDNAQATMEAAVTTAVAEAVANGIWGGFTGGVTNAAADDLYGRGWAAAGIWYNRIAQVNGQLNVAVFASPTVSAYPAILEQVGRIKAKYDNTVSPEVRFDPTAAGIDSIGLLLDKAHGEEYAKVLNTALKDWENASGIEQVRAAGPNPIIAFFKQFFGLSGLYNMRDNQANRTHPLAMLSGVGKSLVESSIRSLGLSIIAVGGGAGTGSKSGKQFANLMASFFITMAMLGLTVGFILFYVVPFLPFIYFFFAVGGWVKGIFEAMVGAPLWALAHIRIDGNGLPGNAALNGYFLIFEVFLRPILIVFGMLASISTFSALVSVLNDIFSLVVENAAGYDLESELATPRNVLVYMRSSIDEFFFTIIYTIVVYMLGMSSFKLVDTMPNNILRWMGQSVATFGDQREDPAQNLVSRASIGSQQALSKMGGGLSGLAEAGVNSTGTTKA